MTHAAKLARHDALTEAIRTTDAAIGDEPPTDQALRIIKALKRLRDDEPVRVDGTERIDYLGKAQEAARVEWMKLHAASGSASPVNDATAGIDTPLGRLVATVWRTNWTGKRGNREAWAGSYTLNDEPITIAEIKAAGLAQRPTSRNRRSK